MLTAEITNTIYERFITLNQGFSLGNNGAWLLLLNKVMGMVAELKQAELTRDNRIELVVAVVIRYLDEKTDLPDDQLQHINTSVRAMCLAMLGYGGELAGKQPTVRMPTDPELVSTPLQITQLLMDKMRELIRRDPNSAENLGAFLPQVVMLCITTVNKFRNLTNLEKRNLVVDVIITFLDEYLAPRLTTPQQQISLGLFKADLGNMVDLFVGIAKGKSEYNFNYRDPQGRRNLLTCIGTGFVRLAVVLGLCFTRQQPRTNQTTDTGTPTNINTATPGTGTPGAATPGAATPSTNNNDLPSIPEETVSTHDEIVNDLPPPVSFTETITTEKKEKHDADDSLPPTPPFGSLTDEPDIDHLNYSIPFETTTYTEDFTNPVELVQVIIDTVSSNTDGNTNTDFSSSDV